jgi:hypothetical protein
MTISYQVLVLPSVLAGVYTNTVTVSDKTANSSVQVRIPLVLGETIEAGTTTTTLAPQGKVLGAAITSTGGSVWTYLLISLLLSFGLYLGYSIYSNKKKLVKEKV